MATWKIIRDCRQAVGHCQGMDAHADLGNLGARGGGAVRAGRAVVVVGGRVAVARRSGVHPGLRRPQQAPGRPCRSEEHTSELQSLMRISYAVFCLKKKTTTSSSMPI